MAESRTLPRILLWSAFTVIVVAGWHYMCVGRMQTNLDLWASSFSQKNPGTKIEVEIRPFSNLVAVKLSYKAEGLAGSLAKGILVLAQQRLERTWEHDLKAKARESADVYAMLFPYHVSMQMN